jgi:hypothetical protein
MQAKYFTVNGLLWKVFYAKSPEHYVLEGGDELFVGLRGEWILSGVMGTRQVTAAVAP